MEDTMSDDQRPWMGRGRGNSSVGKKFYAKERKQNNFPIC